MIPEGQRRDPETLSHLITKVDIGPRSFQMRRRGRFNKLPGVGRLLSYANGLRRIFWQLAFFVIAMNAYVITATMRTKEASSHAEATLGALICVGLLACMLASAAALFVSLTLLPVDVSALIAGAPPSRRAGPGTMAILLFASQVLLTWLTASTAIFYTSQRIDTAYATVPLVEEIGGSWIALYGRCVYAAIMELSGLADPQPLSIWSRVIVATIAALAVIYLIGIFALVAATHGNSRGLVDAHPPSPQENPTTPAFTPREAFPRVRNKLISIGIVVTLLAILSRLIRDRRGHSD